MAVSLQAYADKTAGYASGNVTPVPATTDLITGTWTVADGDVIVMMAGCGEASGAPSPSVGGDWTQLESSSAAMQVGAWYHVVSGTTEPTYTVVRPGSSSIGIALWLLRGADVAAIDSALIDQYSTANLNPASVTCPGDGSAVLVGGWRFDGGSGATPPTGYTERSDKVPEEGYLDPFYACDKFDVGHGTEDPGVITNSGTTEQAAITVAVGAVDRTVTVHKTTGDYSTVQSAVDDCSVYIASGWYKVEVTDAANYDEDLTIPSGEIGTPSATHYLWLTSSGAGTHDGTAGSGAVIEGNSNNECVHITELDYTRISDLEFEYSGGFAAISGFLIYRTVGALISNCIVWSSNRGNVGIQIDSFTADNNSTSIDNTVVYGFERNGIQLNEDGAAAGTGNVLNLDHVSVYDCGDGSAGRGGISILTRVAGDSSTINAYNTWATDNNNNDWFDTDNTPDETTSIGTVTWNGSHNAHGAYGKTDIDGTDNTTNWQNASNDATVTTTTANAAIVTNLTAGTEDFTPVAATESGSNLLLTNGTDRQGSEPDARQDFSTDIAGNTRPTTNVDIGAFQISAEGGGGDDLTGALFSSTPTFFAGALAAEVTGALFSSTPTFFAGDVDSEITGSLFSSTPTFPAGTLGAEITGALFAATPTFFGGALSEPTGDLTGVLFSSTPTFFAGDLAAEITGELFSSTPTFPSGTLVSGLAANFFASTPTFFAGRADSEITGVLFSPTSTFYGGVLTGEGELGAALFTSTPTFYAGALAYEISGTLFVSTPTFAKGLVGDLPETEGNASMGLRTHFVIYARWHRDRVGT